MKTKMNAMILVLCAVLFAGCEQAESPSQELSPDAQKFLTDHGIPVFTGPAGVPLNSGLSGDYVVEEGGQVYLRVFEVEEADVSEIVQSYFEEIAEILAEVNEDDDDEHESLDDLDDLESAIEDGWVRCEWVINNVSIIVSFQGHVENEDDLMKIGGMAIPEYSLVITIGYTSTLHG